MTDKERLEMIKHDFEERSQYGGFLDDNDTNWLIEQAEKVEELTKDNRSLNMEIGSYAVRWQELVEKMDELTEQMKLLTNNMYIPK
ncbi:MAG: hypothetical protein Q8935_10150 [Bacillota bacterium]|nr:hypothetical protein [Bacillota bacterium]